MPTEALTRIAIRLRDPAYDSRHAVLDVANDLLALEDSTESLPAPLREEFREILREVREVRPRFPSRRNTSVLFDRAGLGRIGRERADRLVRRQIALAAALPAAGRG